MWLFSSPGSGSWQRGLGAENGLQDDELAEGAYILE